jgi:hypothetical protein
MSGEDEGLLARWSRLKREGSADERDEAVESGAEAPADAVAADAPAAARTGEAGTGEAGSAEGTPEEERMLTEAELPDIESLTYESDFSVFMKANVPLALQKRALRMLWNSNPVLANLDGLNDHDLDYTISEMKELAAQSAADLARGSKRLNVVDLRAKDREMRHARHDPQRRHQPQPDQRPPDQTGPDRPGETLHEISQAEADTERPGFVVPPARKLDS